MALTIRTYEESDFEDMVRIYNESFKDLRSSWADPMTLEWFMDRFGEELKGGTAFIAEYDGERIGYVLVTSERRPQVGLVIYVSGICVVPRHQRQGIGTKLMERALDWARNRNAVCVENDDEVIENPGAVEFFEKLGFRIFQSGVYMSKDLRLPDEFVLSRTYDIREHRHQDLDDLLEIREEAFKEFGPYYSVSNEVEEFKQRMKSRIGRNDVKVFIAFKTGVPIGYVNCQIEESDKGWWDTGAFVRNISVLPKYRNMDVGSALMVRAFDFLRKNNVRIVGTATETAEGFYEKVGFKADAGFIRVRKRIDVRGHMA